jgi:hypothetical protein
VTGANLSNRTAQAQALSETDTDTSPCIQVHCCLQATAGLIGLCFPGYLRDNLLYIYLHCILPKLKVAAVSGILTESFSFVNNCLTRADTENEAN